MKRSLELDIAECQVHSEEKRRIEEERLRLDYEAKLAIVEKNYVQLTEQLQAQKAEFEEVQQCHSISCTQYEEQLKRLNDKYVFFLKIN
jgi:hypothetical protein